MENSSEKSERKKRANWSIEAEELLLVLWAQNVTKLRANRANFYILSKMSTKMENMGYPYTAYAIKIKIHNLTGRYREERKRVANGFPSPWPMYDSVHRILGSYHASQNAITNHGTEDSSTVDNYPHQNHSEDHFGDANCDEYPNEVDDAAATSMTEYGDNEKSNETMYLKSINRNLVLLVEKINELSEQSRSMEKERSASLKQLLDVLKHHTKEGTVHNSTRTQERHVKKIKLSQTDDRRGAIAHNQDHDYETFSHYIEEDDPLCNDSDMKHNDEDDEEEEKIDKDVTSTTKKSPSVQINKIMLDKKIKEEYLKTKQLERDFMAERHKLQMDILNIELQAKKKSILK